MKFLALAFMLHCLCAFGQPPEKVKVLVRLEALPQGLQAHSLEGALHLPMRLKDRSLEKIIKGLEADDEVVLEGQVIYESETTESTLRFRPVLIIEKLTPISLKRLGKMNDFKVEEKTIAFRLESSYSPRPLKLSDGVVSSLVLTASVLLLKSLAASPTDPDLNSKLTEGLIFSAGALATGSQILEDRFRSSKD